MSSVVIIVDKGGGIGELHSGLARMGFTCLLASDEEVAIRQVAEQAPDLVILPMNGHTTTVWELCRRMKQDKPSPVIALVNREVLDSSDVDLNTDDFVIQPCDVKELALRAKRLLHRNNGDTGELIRCGDLVIDLARCEVTVGSRPVVLTFKEYELLRFLAKNRGRVFTREALLNKVWGYDYYGGDRTVDVHMRRLRSKVEDANHTFIETVRNIGYRFRK